MQPKKGDARNGAEMDSEAKWIRLSKQLFLDLAYMSLVRGSTAGTIQGLQLQVKEGRNCVFSAMQ